VAKLRNVYDLFYSRSGPFIINPHLLAKPNCVLKAPQGQPSNVLCYFS